MIKGCKDSSNFTLVRASDAAGRLLCAVVRGSSPEAFKQSLGDDDTAILAWS